MSTQGPRGALKLTIAHQSEAKQPLWCRDPHALLLRRPRRPRPCRHPPRAPWPSCMGLGLESRPPGSAPIWLCSSTQGGSLGEGSGNGDDPGHGSLSLPLTPAGRATLSSQAAWCFGPGPAELPEMSPGSLQPGPLLSARGRLGQAVRGWVRLPPLARVDKQEEQRPPRDCPPQAWITSILKLTLAPLSLEMPKIGREGLGGRGLSQRQKHERTERRKTAP